MKGTGVYFCTCGGIVTQKVSADAVGLQIGQLEEVAYVTTMEFLCSPEGQEAMVMDLAQKSPDRVVVAACSPRDHENTFRAVLSQTPINPYFLQMANIREQVSWVTSDPDLAAKKAASQIRGAVQRVNLHAPLYKKSIEISPDVLIIGAGPAGIAAALRLAESGREVILVEKSPVIGGMAVRFEEVFPHMECGPCMMEPLLDDLLHGDDAKHIELLTLSEVTDVAGYFGNFLVKIRRQPRHVDETICIGCGECIPPCPATAKNSYNANLDERNAVYFPFAGVLPNFPLIDMDTCLRSHGENCQLCVAACPVEGAFLFTEPVKIIEKNVGAIVVAIGSRLYDCAAVSELGVTDGHDLYTSYAFERLLAQNGPTRGEVVTVRNQTPPASVAIVHCVGSLDAAHRDYCSELCCQNSFKFNLLLQKKMPDTLIHHFYKEIVAPGKDGFSLYRQIRDHPNSRFVRYPSGHDLQIARHEQGYHVVYTDANGYSGRVEAEMVILCPALVPAEDAAQISAMLEVKLDRLGFFAESHNRLHAVRSTIRGIYIAGTCQAPMDLQKSMNQGVAVAGYILSELVAGRQIDIEPVTALVDEERCSGCRVCLVVCPYKAIHLDEAGKKSRVNAVLCAGCGTCVAACPAGVIKGNHFTNEAIFAEIAGVLA